MNENKTEPGTEQAEPQGKPATLPEKHGDGIEHAEALMAKTKAQVIGVDMGAPDGDLTGTTQGIMDAVKAQIEERIGEDVDAMAASMNPTWPVSLTTDEARAEAYSGTGNFWGGEEGVFFQFNNGPLYEKNLDSLMRPVEDELVREKALKLLASFDEGDQAEDLIEADFEAEDAGDQGHEDGHDSLYDDDYEADDTETAYLAELDEIIMPRMITEQDLRAADLAGGPAFTHAEALLAALAAADAVAPDWPMDEDMAEALYEFAEKEKWEVQPETLYRQAMTLMEGDADLFSSLDVDTRHWFLTFTHVGKAMAAEARARKAEYVGKLELLKREIERTRGQRKLADRKAEKQKKREQRPVLLKRAAERWRKNQKKNEAKAERARRAGRPGRPKA